MKRKVLLDLSILQEERFCGLGQIAINYARYYKENYSEKEDYELFFLVPRDMFGAFGPNITYIEPTKAKRELPFLMPYVDAWHAIHQLSKYRPFWSRTKYILTIHDCNFIYETTGEKQEKYRKRLQRKIDRADRIIGISHFTKDEVSKYFDLKGKEIEVIYNGVERLDVKEAKQPQGVDPSTPFFFTIGQINPKKNFHVLLPLMKFFPEKNLYIVGSKDSSYATSIEETIKQEGLKNVHLLGVASDEERVWLYKNCKAFFFPSLLEGFGLPVIEALSFGKPVFSSSATSLKEIGGEHVFFWDNFEPEAMKLVIDENLNKFDQSPTLKQNEIEYALSFSYKEHIEKYIRIYKELGFERK